MIAIYSPPQIVMPADVARAASSRSRPAEAADEEAESLLHIAREIGRELESDGILIAWHESEREPLYLFADQNWEPGSLVEREMVAMGTAAATLPNPTPRSQWRSLDGATPSGLLTTSIPTGRGVVTVTTLFKRVGAPTRMRAGEAAARLLPLVQPFFRVWTAHLRSADRLQALTAAINRSDVGVLLVDGQARLAFANDMAEALISRNDGVRRQGETLAASRFADTLKLHATIDHVLAPRGKAATAPILALDRDNGRPLMAAVLPVAPDAKATAGSAAIIYLFDPERDLRSLLEPVCRHYGLTGVETRLACLIADGMSLAEAAKATRVREMTARSYLKQVFLKTNTKRQAELVAMMLKSAVRSGSHFSRSVT